MEPLSAQTMGMAFVCVGVGVMVVGLSLVVSAVRMMRYWLS